MLERLREREEGLGCRQLSSSNVQGSYFLSCGLLIALLQIG